MFPDTKSALIWGIIEQSALKRSLIPAIIRFFFHPFFLFSSCSLTLLLWCGIKEAGPLRKKKLLSSNERRWHKLTDHRNQIASLVQQRSCSWSSEHTAATMGNIHPLEMQMKMCISGWFVPRGGCEVTLSHMTALCVLQALLVTSGDLSHCSISMVSSQSAPTDLWPLTSTGHFSLRSCRSLGISTVWAHPFSVNCGCNVKIPVWHQQAHSTMFFPTFLAPQRVAFTNLDKSESTELLPCMSLTELQFCCTSNWIVYLIKSKHKGLCYSQFLSVMDRIKKPTWAHKSQYQIIIKHIFTSPIFKTWNQFTSLISIFRVGHFAITCGSFTTGNIVLVVVTLWLPELTCIVG